MNKKQSDQILGHVSELECLDLDKLYSQWWPEKNIDEQTFGPFSPAQLSNIIKKLSIDLRLALEKEWITLPFNFQDFEIGQSTLVDAINQTISSLNQNQPAPARQWITFLVRYLTLYGYWDRGEKPKYNEIDDQFAENAKALEINLNDARNALAKLNKEHEELSNLVQAKRKELNEIESLRDSARTDQGEIQEILKESGVQKSKLDTIVEEQNSNKESISSALKKSNEQLTETGNKLKESINLLESTEKNHQHISSKRDETDKMVAYIAAGTLSGAFGNRAQELTKSVSKWQRVIFLATILGIIWLVFTFQFLPKDSVDPLISFLIASLKLAPALVFIGWTLKQYGRERSFLEEYRFKAALAMTVNAYADTLADEKFSLREEDFSGNVEQFRKYREDREKLRKQLIKETIDRLYRDPRIHGTQTHGLFLRPNAVKETAKELRELVKEIKGLPEGMLK